MTVSLRYASLALFLVLLPFLLINNPDGSGSKLWAAIWNFGHVVFFFVLTYLVLWRLETRLPSVAVSTRRSLMIVLALAMVGLGWLIEVVQLWFGRDYELEDVLADTAGTLLALVFSDSWGQAAGGAWRRLGGQVLALVMLLFVGRNVLWLGSDNALQASEYPVLYQPSTLALSRLELTSAVARNVHAPELSPDALLRVELHPGVYSTVSLNQLQRDWRGHQALVWRWYNPGQPLAIKCRVHDQQHVRNGLPFHDRFNGNYVLQPGWQELVMSLDALQNAPRGRLMDLSEIRSTACFAMDLAAPRELYLHSITLR